MCMGNAVSSDQQPVSAVESLGREKPTKLMAQLRAVWPQVEQALQAGHTLRLIHQRLNMAGIQISYGCLIVYRGRIKSGKKTTRRFRGPKHGRISEPPGPHATGLRSPR